MIILIDADQYEILFKWFQVGINFNVCKVSLFLNVLLHVKSMHFIINHIFKIKENEIAAKFSSCFQKLM